MPPPAAARKNSIANPGYPKSLNGVSIRISIAAPMISAASSRPSVIRFAIFCRPSMPRAGDEIRPSVFEEQACEIAVAFQPIRTQRDAHRAHYTKPVEVA
jgi:hypothetical protein